MRRLRCSQLIFRWLDVGRLGYSLEAGRRSVSDTSIRGITWIPRIGISRILSYKCNTIFPSKCPVLGF